MLRSYRLSQNAFRRQFSTAGDGSESKAPEAGAAAATATETKSAAPKYSRTKTSYKKRNGFLVFAQFGLPMILFIGAGSLLLDKFVSTHIEAKDARTKTQTYDQFNIEQEYKSILDNLDIDNYKLSRIPRPEDKEQKDAFVDVPL